MKTLNYFLTTCFSIIATLTSSAHAQTTIDPSSYVFSEAQGTGGYVFTGYLLPVLNAPFQAIADAATSVGAADGTFVSAPGYALLRLDVDHDRSASLGDLASSAMSIIFTITEDMPYELTGEYNYVGFESAHYLVNLYSTGCIYCGEQNMNSPGTVTVGTLTGGQLPNGPTTGILPAGTYSILLESFIYANLGESAAEANGFVQLKLGTTPCPADLDDSGIVDVSDLLALLGAWGTSGADIDGDGNTNVQDLLLLLAAWGACPS